MKNFLIKDGVVVNEGTITKNDILILNGIISAIENNIVLSDDFIKENNVETVVANDKYVLPGCIDDQVHFREPGLTHKADIFTESSAAVAGGITSFMDMPNTVPPTTTIELLEQKYLIASQTSLANYSFYLGATNDNIKELKRFDPQKNCGIKVFLGASTGNLLVDNEKTLEDIFRLPFLIAIHSEDEETIRQNSDFFRGIYGDDVPAEIHPKIRSTEACYKSTLKAIERAKKFNTRLHILHLSTKKELELLYNTIPLQEKKITSEVCVHHLWFNENDYKQKGNLIKWNPSIKTAEDQTALFQAILDGTIDIVATDHAPHTLEEKQRKYFQAPSGGPLVQHSLLMMLEFYHNKKISLERIVALMCHKPAECFRIKQRGYIRENYYADLVIIDTTKTTEVTKDSLFYKCGWSPLEGYVFRSKVAKTFVNGKMVYDGVKVLPEVKGMRLVFNC